jgi:hypothetical protein
MLQRDGSYNAGDVYGFSPEIAAKLVALRKARPENEADLAVLVRFMPVAMRGEFIVEKQAILPGIAAPPVAISLDEVTPPVPAPTLPRGRRK